MVDELDITHLFQRGHVAYESGEHGDVWIALEMLFIEPARLASAAMRLAERLTGYGADLVCGPLVGGALVGQVVAQALNTKFVYSERTALGDYAIAPAMRPIVNGSRAIVVDDAINAGVATLACVEELERHGASIVAIGSVIFRTPGTLSIWAERQFPVEYLVGRSWNSWPVDDCPLCRVGVPIDSWT